MHYISTRGQAPRLNFTDTMLTGLASDGGLYVPESWPTMSADELRALANASYAEIAAAVLSRFVGETMSAEELAEDIGAAYGSFRHEATVPLKQLGDNTWLLELFHGPTLAFKDVALQLLGRFFDRELTRRNRRITVVGATSGDTGSAAIEACRDLSRVDTFILFPEGRVSEVQRRQMTTVPGEHIHAIAIRGNFDDCQDLVKAMFADVPFRDAVGLSAVNSINWARIIAQTVYYVSTALRLGAPDRAVGFAVPTGNFGNVYAAYVARQLGVPIERLIIGTNRNDVLARYFENGEMRLSAVEPSLSPSMDIQISSNFERLLFEMLGRDGGAVDGMMKGLRSDGVFSTGDNEMASIAKLFSAYRADDALTKATIAEVYEQTGEVIDPHTAAGLAAVKQYRAAKPADDVPLVSLACAHPAKFPDAVQAAIDVSPSLPPHLADLHDREERMTVLDNDLQIVEAHIKARSRAAALNAS
ncbi:MAG: threonine synthase [Alphaproteobacteria bacterium]|nr:threonine synthase [Alphaproteobacteria bacterium SS10]